MDSTTVNRYPHSIGLNQIEVAYLLRRRAQQSSAVEVCAIGDPGSFSLAALCPPHAAPTLEWELLQFPPSRPHAHRQPAGSSNLGLPFPEARDGRVAGSN